MAPHLAPISSQKLLRLLRALGFEQIRQKGSHCFFRHPGDGRTTVVPLHASEDIGKGLLKKILADIRLDASEFRRMRR